jgi:hypothetical protein
VADHADIPGWKRRRALSDYLSHSEISRRAYYIYPDGELAAETLWVIGQAMAHSNRSALDASRSRAGSGRFLWRPRGACLLMSPCAWPTKSARPNSEPSEWRSRRRHGGYRRDDR